MVKLTTKYQILVKPSDYKCFEYRRSEVENKICSHDKYVTTPEFNKLTAKCFAARFKQATLVNKTDSDNKAVIDELLQIKQNI